MVNPTPTLDEAMERYVDNKYYDGSAGASETPRTTIPQQRAIDMNLLASAMVELKTAINDADPADRDFLMQNGFSLSGKTWVLHLYPAQAQFEGRQVMLDRFLAVNVEGSEVLLCCHYPDRMVSIPLMGNVGRGPLMFLLRHPSFMPKCVVERAE